MADYPLGNWASRLNIDTSFMQPTSVAESEWLPAEIETARIINVNIETWSVDCIAEYANKRYFDLQVMAPYFHFANGEGIYAQPEVGALCWLCTASAGRFAAPFVMGFQSAHDEDFDSFRGGRQTLNPGDIMLRTRDENFLVLRRGGVVQIGSTPVCQTMYVPIGNFLRHFCEQYELNTFGGSLEWTNSRTDKTADGNVLTTLTLSVREKVDSPAHDVVLTVGSHGDGEPTRLELDIFESGETSAEVKVHLGMTKEGDVSWDIEQNWNLIAKQDIILLAEEGVFTADAKGDWSGASSNGNVLLKAAQGEAVVDGMKAFVGKSSTKSTLDAPLVHLGANAPSPLIKGDMLVPLLTNLFTYISTGVCAPGAPIATAPAIAALTGQLSGLLSTVSFTK